MTDFFAYELLTWPEVAALPRTTPLVIPLGDGYAPASIAAALGNPPAIGLLPAVPFGWPGSGLAVPEPIFGRLVANLADSRRDDGFSQVYVLTPQPPQALVQRSREVSRGEVLASGLRQNAALGADHDVGGHPFQGAPDEFLAVPVAVGVRGIEKRDAAVDRASDRRQRVAVVDRAPAHTTQCPAAEADLRDPETGTPENPVAHRRRPQSSAPAPIGRNLGIATSSVTR